MKHSDEPKNKSLGRGNMDAALLENFIHLQKVLTNLALKFDHLSSNISRMLELFEISAKNFAEKAIEKGSVDSEFLKKLDALLDQNKTISRGIMMMEEKVRNRMEMGPPQSMPMVAPQMTMPAQSMPMTPSQGSRNPSMGMYKSRPITRNI